jgi:hypothetical protein
MHDDDTMAAMVEAARGLIEARGSSLHCFAARK